MAQRRERLAECREAKHPGVKENRDLVAADLDISKVYLRGLENGTLKPGRDVMLRMSSYYEKPLEYLFPDLFAENQAASLCPE